MPASGFFRPAPARNQDFQAGYSLKLLVFSGSHQPGTEICRLVQPETKISRLVTSPEPGLLYYRVDCFTTESISLLQSRFLYYRVDFFTTVYFRLVWAGKACFRLVARPRTPPSRENKRRPKKNRRRKKRCQPEKLEFRGFRLVQSFSG